MHFYRISTNLTVSGGSANFTTLDVIGGLCRQTYIKAQTSTTYFKANLVNDNSLTTRDYGFHKGEINDYTVYPLNGIYTLSITNASATDTFNVLLEVQE